MSGALQASLGTGLRAVAGWLDQAQFTLSAPAATKSQIGFALSGPLPPVPGGAAGGLFVQLRGSGYLAQGPVLPVTGTREETRTWTSPGATR